MLVIFWGDLPLTLLQHAPGLGSIVSHFVFGLFQNTTWGGGFKHVVLTDLPLFISRTLKKIGRMIVTWEKKYQQPCPSWHDFASDQLCGAIESEFGW